MADQPPAVVVAEPSTGAASDVTQASSGAVAIDKSGEVTGQPAAVSEEPPKVALTSDTSQNQCPEIIIDDYEKLNETTEPEPDYAVYGQSSNFAINQHDVVNIAESISSGKETVELPLRAASSGETISIDEPAVVPVEEIPALADVEIVGGPADNGPAKISKPVAQPYHPPHEHYEHKKTTTKKSSKKKPKGSRHIELMEWLPTLPQLFAYLGFTQFLLMFWVFIGECANDIGATWNLVMMWLTVVITTALFFVYNLLLAKKCPLRSLTATILAFTTELFLFQLPILLSSGDDSQGGRIVLALFRMLIIALVVVLYSVAYIEDLRSGPPEPGEVVVVTNGGSVEPQPVHTHTTISNDYAQA